MTNTNVIFYYVSIQFKVILLRKEGLSYIYKNFFEYLNYAFE